MVQLEEVEDEEFVPGEKGEFEDDDDFTDTDSEISDPDLDASESPYGLDGSSESITDRIIALKDMIPPQTRRKMADTLDATYGWTWSGLQLGGKAAWIISTSILLLGVPFGMALAEEAQAMEIEKEQQQRDLGNEMFTPGGDKSTAGQAVAQGQAKAAL